jgi:hypothetical protein
MTESMTTFERLDNIRRIYITKHDYNEFEYEAIAIVDDEKIHEYDDNFIRVKLCSGTKDKCVAYVKRVLGTHLTCA